MFKLVRLLSLFVYYYCILTFCNYIQQFSFSDSISVVDMVLPLIICTEPDIKVLRLTNDFEDSYQLRT